LARRDATGFVQTDIQPMLDRNYLAGSNPVRYAVDGYLASPVPVSHRLPGDAAWQPGVASIGRRSPDRARRRAAVAYLRR